MQKRIYFAYGANTNKEAMAIRCPKAKPIGAGHIVDYKLKFNNVADIVSKNNKYAAVQILMNPEYWDKCMDHVNIILDSKCDFNVTHNTIMALKIISLLKKKVNIKK